MKNYFLHIVLFFCFVQVIYSQDNGVVAFSLPIRNSLKFNKYAINPTFSFVREQNKYVSFTNKRQWIDFNNPPQMYLFSYSGRFNENTGMGIGLFQQDYGVLTTFGGLLNYAQNVVLDRDSNLTFGINVGFYKSGLNNGNVVVNFQDPSLDNIPSNALITVNPGINYGNLFLDFGVSINNLVLYNVNTSELLKDNQEQNLQAHAMYTGFIESRGFFDQSKFSALLRSQFSKENTTLSGLVMLSIPKGIWSQIGYNTLYGVSGGIGVNLSENIAIEYNFEKSIGEFLDFGNSHEITLAYKFNKRERYNYSDDEEEGALIQRNNKARRYVAKRKPNNKVKTNKQSVAQKVKPAVNSRNTRETKISENQVNSNQKEALSAKLEDEKINAQEEALKLKQLEEQKARLEAQEKQALEQAKIKAEEARLQADREAKAKAEETARKKIEAEQKAKQLEEQKARLEAQEKQALERAKIKEEETRLKLEAEKALRENEAAKLQTKQAQNLNELNTEPVQEIQVKTNQDKLLEALSESIAIKAQDLKDLKEENDLSEQGIYKEPKVFKSISAENAALESLTLQIDATIQQQNLEITNLQRKYDERIKNNSNVQDSISMIYLNEIEIIRKAQSKTIREKEKLVSQLQIIKEATEIERRRRIKRAAYDSEQDRYNKDRATLNVLKESAILSNVPLTEKDFDFGDIQSNNIQILKDVKNVEKGYYNVVAVHNSVEKRDEFVRNALAAGQNNINFFYDVNTSKYYIYYEKFDDIESAQRAIQSKENTGYNAKMLMVKIEN